MIAKHIPMNVAKKSSFAYLVHYLTDQQSKEGRTGAVRVTNCISDDIELAALEVLNTQAINTRSLADKTYHLIISFRAGEEPDANTLAAIEERVCDGVGFTGHQRVSVVHHDTDNLHLHVAINKIHPTRHTILEPFHAYPTFARLCDTLEDDYSLQKDNHMPRKVGAENRAADMEHHAGIESLLGWVQREYKTQMQQAKSWDQLHAALSVNGLQLRVRANGLVITADDGTTIKASSVGREFSKPRLESRFGPFEPAPEQDIALKPARQYARKPLASLVDTTEMYARYRSVQAQAAAIRRSELDCARARKEQTIEAVVRSVRLKRAALNLAKLPRAAQKLMCNALMSSMREEIADIKQAFRQERERISQQHRRRQWVDWLRHESQAGDVDALVALRARKRLRELTANSIYGKNLAKGPPCPGGQDSVTKTGTIIYRIGASAVRDDGDKLRVSRGADTAAMQAALRMAKERYGARLTVNGSDAFKEQIILAAVIGNLSFTFDDPVLEGRRLQLTNPASAKVDAIDNSRAPRLHSESNVKTLGPPVAPGPPALNSVTLKKRGSHVRSRR